MSYKKASRQTLLPTISQAHNDHEAPSDACPACRRPYDLAPILTPFDAAKSGALDLARIAHDALHALTAALEDEVLS